MNITATELLNGTNKHSKRIFAAFLLIVLGYICFFISPFVLPNNSKIILTEYFKDIQTKDGNVIRLIRCDYSKEQQKIQYELEVKNRMVKPYEFNITYRTKTGAVSSGEVQPLYRDGDIYVINILNVPDDFFEMQFAINDVNGTAPVRAANIYSSKASVNSIPEVTDKALNIYKTDRAKLHITENNAEIAKIQNEINSLWYEIGLLQQAIIRFEESKRFQTAGEISDTNKVILQSNSEINNYNKSIIEKEEAINELNRKNAKANELINELSEITY